MKPFLVFAITIAAMGAGQKSLNRPPGQYPGNPAENFAPVLKPSTAGRRNLALRRPAYQSSAYDYNLTAQLATDGIHDSEMPRWIVTSSSAQGVLPRNQREWPLDDSWVTTVDVKGRSAWVQIEFGGAFTFDQINLDWIRKPAAAMIQASGGAKSWLDLQPAAAGEIRLAAEAKARYVDLPKVRLEVASKPELAGGVWRPTVTIKNPSAAPALMVRVKPVAEKSGQRLLPAIISDSYLILLPGESKTVTVEVAEADARGERLAVAVDGFNVTSGR